MTGRRDSRMQAARAGARCRTDEPFLPAAARPRPAGRRRADRRRRARGPAPVRCPCRSRGVGGGRRNNQLGLWLSVGGVVVLAVAAAGPAAALPVGRSAGTVILAMDVSNSMSADDVTPSRLAVAQQAAQSFIDAQPDSVDIGVVGFDQGALTTSLPSADRAASKAAVQSMRTAGGTSLASAILGSLSAITGEPVRIGEDGELPDIGYLGLGDHRAVLRRRGPGRLRRQ